MCTWGVNPLSVKVYRAPVLIHDQLFHLNHDVQDEARFRQEQDNRTLRQNDGVRAIQRLQQNVWKVDINYLKLTFFARRLSVHCRSHVLIVLRFK